MISPLACDLDADFGQLNCLLYAFKNGRRRSRTACWGADTGGYMDHLNFLHENWWEWRRWIYNIDEVRWISGLSSLCQQKWKLLGWSLMHVSRVKRTTGNRAIFTWKRMPVGRNNFPIRYDEWATWLFETYSSKYLETWLKNIQQYMDICSVYNECTKMDVCRTKKRVLVVC